MREFGYYILFGGSRNEANHCEIYLRQLNVRLGTQPIVKHSDFTSPCNINNFDGIENGKG